MEDIKGTSGYSFSLSLLFSWCSKKQAVVAQSIEEVEYIVVVITKKFKLFD